MKRTIALLFVFALLLVIVAPAGFSVNTQSVNTVFHSSIWADGGTPVPPLPDIAASTTHMWADGGTPVPPLPDIAASTTHMWADGGTPVPPLPDTAASLIVATNG